MGSRRNTRFIFAPIQVCSQESFRASSNTSEISISCLSKIGSNTDWSRESLELEFDKVLREQLK